ncbi:hypothetical protein LJC59_04420 [Desulfovibrio sp. OttesenSCG-928-A18]|nr:hypothetical protein [Desulfovibrio sp. OttesenSCG-928-A18]
MSARYPAFDPSGLVLRPLAERDDDLREGFVLPLRAYTGHIAPAIAAAADAMTRARTRGANTLFLCGAHVLRAGVQRYLFDMMHKGFVQGIAVNGAMAVHDYELALRGTTTESVARYIKDGRFGMWRETGQINEIVNAGAARGEGFGEALGKELAEGAYVHKELSLFARAWELGIPVTVHVSIGYDIIHAHPNFDGGATGTASHRDFLIFAALLDKLERGVLCSFGSAVMAPEVFLKALSMVRNAALAQGRSINHFTSLVCDLLDIPEQAGAEAPKNDPRYYFRPWKTLLSRTVAGGGRSWYCRARHEESFPQLWQALMTTGGPQ